MTTQHDPQPETQPDAWIDRRADARRNHERVLAAAIEVFTEQGLDATIPEIATRAGVGKATVYRSYPTKADLIHAIADLHLTWLRDQITAALATEDAYQGLESFIVTVMSRLAEDRLMVEVFGSFQEAIHDLSPEQCESRAGDKDLMRLLLDRVCLQGQIRSDVTEMDFQVLIGGTARALISMEVSDPATWQRYARLALSALRP